MQERHCGWCLVPLLSFYPGCTIYLVPCRTLLRMGDRPRSPQIFEIYLPGLVAVRWRPLGSSGGGLQMTVTTGSPGRGLSIGTGSRCYSLSIVHSGPIRLEDEGGKTKYGGRSGELDRTRGSIRTRRGRSHRSRSSLPRSSAGRGLAFVPSSMAAPPPSLDRSYLPGFSRGYAFEGVSLSRKHVSPSHWSNLGRCPISRIVTTAHWWNGTHVIVRPTWDGSTPGPGARGDSLSGGTDGVGSSLRTLREDQQSTRIESSWCFASTRASRLTQRRLEART